MPFLLTLAPYLLRFGLPLLIGVGIGYKVGYGIGHHAGLGDGRAAAYEEVRHANDEARQRGSEGVHAVSDCYAAGGVWNLSSSKCERAP
jgi:hypothetical protein